ncbi:MAG: 1,4-dihydroxy-6-naphthoate synthase [Desulfotignum sp.]|nr:1,4-dihydroxy-6-naphthoate synthase [Desulfotignum sp.]MCF8137617.1 1,4-dihydroxy-6-naphthoate synthase [Desulfotignum sp.]
MQKHPRYRLAYSSCPNDTFIFKAIAGRLIDLKEWEFHICMEDVEALNQAAVQRIHDITKLSFAALGNLLDRYALLRSGAALGRGCGPLVVSRPGRSLTDAAGKKPSVAVPGMGTTAYHLFRFFMADRFPEIDVTVKPMSFEKIMPAVADNTADFGLIIHEGRFVYPSLGLARVADLGQWWEDKTELPIPLGCMAVRRDMASDTACRIQALIRESIDHAFAHPDLGAEYIRDHAQEMDDTVIRQHIDLYVNDFSKDLGEAGEQAVTAFFSYARKTGMIPDTDLPLFAC